MKYLLLTLFFGSFLITDGQDIDKLARQIEPKMIEWRHHFHQNPELSNREFNTAKKIEEHLRGLGLEVQTGVAYTGVVGILKGGKPGPVIGIRADIDGLPVTERVDIPYKSEAIGEYNGEKSGVMHACGHDTHISVAMAVAEILAGMKKDLNGTVKFVFQPAEEGPPKEEGGGAPMMVKEGVLKNPDVDVMFGMHIKSNMHVGSIGYKTGGIMAAADRLYITVNGKQSHGSRPWAGIDPITVSSQIIMGLQTIVSRQMELTKEAAVISIGQIEGGVRFNIIPESVSLVGTIRTLDPEMQKSIHQKIERTTRLIAESAGATADVEIFIENPVTYNDPELTTMMAPSLKKSCEDLQLVKASTGAEDFSFFALEVPSIYFWVGGCPKDIPLEEAPDHHTPDFYVDDSGMVTGVKAFLNLTLDYMKMNK
ncbi:MAG: amidohydrolase [Bacteroidota bacterium]